MSLHGSDLLFDPLGGDTLGSLDRETQSTVPDDTRKDTQGTGDTEQDGVVVLLLQLVVLQQHTTVGINIRPRVSGLTVLSENLGDHIVQLSDQLEHGVLRQVLHGELTLTSVSRIGLTKNSVSETGNNTATVQDIPASLLDLVVGVRTVTESLLQVQQPTEDLLVGQTVKGTSQTFKPAERDK